MNETTHAEKRIDGYDPSLTFRSSLKIRCLVGLVLLYSVLLFIGSTLVPPVYVVKTEEVLPGSLEESWQALTDFASYPDWNPYLTAVDGQFKVGENIVLTLVVGRNAMRRQSHAVLAEIEVPHRFSWQGQQFPLPGIAHTRHVFALEGIDESRTRLYHYEEFRGLAVALFKSGREAEIARNRQAFDLMNAALRSTMQR